MITTQTTAPTTTSVSLSELKAHLKIDSNDEYGLLTRLLAGAVKKVEQITGRQLNPATWQYVIQDWPTGDAITLPYGNLTSVTSVVWTDTDGDATTLTETTDYLVETNGDQCGRLVLPYGKSWPSGSLYPSNPITITFVCGYTAVPEDLKIAVLFAAESIYQRGEDKERYKAILDFLTCNYRLHDEFS